MTLLLQAGLLQQPVKWLGDEAVEALRVEVEDDVVGVVDKERCSAPDGAPATGEHRHARGFLDGGGERRCRVEARRLRRSTPDRKSWSVACRGAEVGEEMSEVAVGSASVSESKMAMREYSEAATRVDVGDAEEGEEEPASAVKMEVEGGDEGDDSCSAALCHWAFISSSLARISANISSIVVMVVTNSGTVVVLSGSSWIWYQM
jgi:hypothetical protein